MNSWPIYFIARLVIAFFRVIPRAAGAAVIRQLATVFYYLDARHRHIADVNLRIAFPEMPPRRRNAVARRSFQNAGMNLLEISRLDMSTPENISSLADYDKADGLNNYRAALNQGRGILYLTGHFSSWELLPTAHALHGYPLSFTTRPLDNVRLEKYLRRIRESKGNTVIYKKDSARRILKELKAGRTVGVLMDQNVNPAEGVFADFFGVPAATSTGVALLALRTEAPVLTGYLTPLRNGRYTFKFLPPLDMVRTGDTAEDLRVNTQRLNNVLERIIREQPESWLWGHKRWKNRPPEDPRDIYSLSPRELDGFLRARAGS
ncbi:MAG: lysophospholipid acyltransferase family protein [Acidobacteria bacterium]|nr:lysophospholipid acyltransferase family protein [Acidobacteriota bacterium]